MKDWCGTEIKAGDVLAIASNDGRRAVLRRRFVRSVHDDHVFVQPSAEEPADRRNIGRVTNTLNSIIVS